MSMFRKFRHYSTKKVVEVMVQPEEEGVRNRPAGRCVPVGPHRAVLAGL